MRTTAILNLKGGVGKTTTVIHMANILHRDYGARVLVVDCDHQHNLTQFFDADPKKGTIIIVMVTVYIRTIRKSAFMYTKEVAEPMV